MRMAMLFVICVCCDHCGVISDPTGHAEIDRLGGWEEIEKQKAQGKQVVTNERKHITQPADWWEAFKAEADKHGLSLAEWLGEAGKSMLPKKVVSKLSERPPAHRPRKDKPSE